MAGRKKETAEEKLARLEKIAEKAITLRNRQKAIMQKTDREVRDSHLFILGLLVEQGYPDLDKAIISRLMEVGETKLHGRELERFRAAFVWLKEKYQPKGKGELPS